MKAIKQGLFMAEMKDVKIKNAWKTNSCEKIKLIQGNKAQHGPWAPPQTNRGGRCLDHSHLLLLLLLHGTSNTVVLTTVCPCWVALGLFCYCF